MLISKVLKKLSNKGLINAFKTKKKNMYIYIAAEYMPEENMVGGNLFK